MQSTVTLGRPQVLGLLEGYTGLRFEWKLLLKLNSMWQHTVFYFWMNWQLFLDFLIYFSECDEWKKTVSLSFSFLSDIYTFFYMFSSYTYVYYVSRGIIRLFVAIIFPQLSHRRGGNNESLRGLLPYLQLFFSCLMKALWLNGNLHHSLEQHKAPKVGDPWLCLSPFMCAHSNAANCMRAARISWILVSAVNDRPGLLPFREQTDGLPADLHNSSPFTTTENKLLPCVHPRRSR